MTSHNLMNFNPEAYKYTRSAAPSRSGRRLIDIIPINYIVYTHNFYTNGKQRFRISVFNHMLPVKIRLAIPKPWQVKQEIKNKIAVTFFAKFLPTLCC